jgi:hypothetical protein
MRADDGTARLAEVRGRLAAYRSGMRHASDEDLLALRQDARAAIDRLDDEPEFDDAHVTLDEVGKLVRSTRAHLCILTEQGEDFTQDCPVALGHIRVGLSIGAEIEESHCSICERDLWECPHVPGQEYDGQSVTRVITKARLFDVSLVDRPDFPDARIMSQPVSRVDVEARLGSSLPANARPVCNRCMAPCPGI